MRLVLHPPNEAFANRLANVPTGHSRSSATREHKDRSLPLPLACKSYSGLRWITIGIPSARCSIAKSANTEGASGRSNSNSPAANIRISKSPTIPPLVFRKRRSALAFAVTMMAIPLDAQISEHGGARFSLTDRLCRRNFPPWVPNPLNGCGETSR